MKPLDLTGKLLHTRAKTHGLNGTPEHIVWTSMRGRCLNPNNHAYSSYGGRGIDICPRWDDFLLFLEDMGAKPSRVHSLERKNNDLGYSPENCVWATRREQANNRRSSRWITFNGETRTLAQWADSAGISQAKLFHRLRLGWPMEKAVGGLHANLS